MSLQVHAVDHHWRDWLATAGVLNKVGKDFLEQTHMTSSHKAVVRCFVRAVFL